DQPTNEDTGSSEEGTQDNGSQNDVQTNIETGQKHQESSKNVPEQDTNTENTGTSKTDFSLIELADENDGSNQSDGLQGDGADGE
ncbi:hypothetical protein GUF45_24760, partial [Xanthomonas citri pv. citri]|nr:hypothetical protein [Xanthomonas citri pv. citri]